MINDPPRLAPTAAEFCSRRVIAFVRSVCDLSRIHSRWGGFPGWSGSIRRLSIHTTACLLMLDATPARELLLCWRPLYPSRAVDLDRPRLVRAFWNGEDVAPVTRVPDRLVFGAARSTGDPRANCRCGGPGMKVVILAGGVAGALGSPGRDSRCSQADVVEDRPLHFRFSGHHIMTVHSSLRLRRFVVALGLKVSGEELFLPLPIYAASDARSTSAPGCLSSARRRHDETEKSNLIRQQRS